MTDSHLHHEALARNILSRKEQVAGSVTDEFLERHPDWLDEYGEQARTKGIQDAVFHTEFLAGALVAGSPEAFADYARWASRMLSARGIAPRFVAENIEQVGAACVAEVPADGAGLIREYVTAGRRAALEGAEDESRGAFEADEDDLRLAREVYLQGALRGDRGACLNVVEEAIRDGASHADVYPRILQEAQYEIGRRWERNEISVAEEHTATAVTQYVMARLYESLPRGDEERGTAVVTGVSGELHQVGANMVADMLEMDGWDVRFVGTDLPHRDVVRLATESAADLVAISMTILANLERGGELVRSLRERLGEESPRILVGGAAFRASPDAWKKIGADQFAPDLETAVEVARELAEAPRGGPVGDA